MGFKTLVSVLIFLYISNQQIKNINYYEKFKEIKEKSIGINQWW